MSDETGNREEVGIELPFAKQFDKYGSYEAHARGALSRFECIAVNNDNLRTRNQVIYACMICINKTTDSKKKLRIRQEYRNWLASIEKASLTESVKDDRILQVSIAFAGIVESLLADFMDTNTTNITVEFAAKPVYMADFEKENTLEKLQDYEYSLKGN